MKNEKTKQQETSKLWGCWITQMEGKKDYCSSNPVKNNRNREKEAWKSNWDNGDYQRHQKEEKKENSKWGHLRLKTKRNEVEKEKGIEVIEIVETVMW